jgi:hypothetical protein
MESPEFGVVISSIKIAPKWPLKERGQVYEQAQRGARKGFLKMIFRLIQNGK